MSRSAGIKMISNKEIDNATLIESVEKLDGVLKVTIEDKILYYELQEKVSSYDVMVSIMNLLYSNFGVDSEPYTSIEDDEPSEEDIVNVIDETIPENNEKEDKKSKLDKKLEEAEESIWFKIAQIGVAVICMIVGLILESKNLKAYSYVFIVGFAFAGYEIFYDAIAGLFKKKYFSEDVLMMIASIAAFLLGEMAESIGILVLFIIGEMFEDKAVENSSKLIDDLKIMTVRECTVINSEGEEELTQIESVLPGMTVIVKPGEKIPLDGVIIEGRTNVDERALTGESNYRLAEKDNEVYEGSIAVDGMIKVLVTKNYENSTFAKIIKIVESAENKKAKSEKFIEKFSKWYTPLMLILAVLLAFIPPIFYDSYGEALSTWGVRAVMLLCISCPCSIAVSVPLAYFCGIGNAANNGIIVKGSEYLDTLALCDTFVFDKTGTLTEGKFGITKIVSVPEFKGKVLLYAAAAESYSKHPLAKAILEKNTESINQSDIKDYTEIAGRGISLTYKGEKILTGNEKLLVDNGVSVASNDDLGMKLYVAVNGKFAGLIVLNDTIRSNAYGAVNELYEYGVVNTIMLTGDNRDYAKVIRQSLNMKKSYSELMPQDKVAKMEEIIESEEKGKVAYVGDGINDAPVIKRSDVGIAMGGCGSDAAIESADVVISDDDLSKVPYVYKLAKRTRNISMENIIGSLSIKAIVFLLTVTCLVSNLWLAIASDVGLLILCIINAVRNKVKIK